MKTEPTSTTYTFKQGTLESSFSFEPMLGKPSPHDQAVMHALDLYTRSSIPVELWHDNRFIATIGRKK